MELKTKVFRKYIYDRFKHDGDGYVFLYIGIRADESGRAKNSNSTDNYINECHPFIENGITKQDVEKILLESGIGYSDYYKWRKRSGCYFCFYQSKNDWINLYENHPDLFYKAMEYEFNDCDKIKQGRFGWNLDMSLADMIKPENMAKIKDDYQKLQEKRAKKLTGVQSEKLIDIFDDDCDEGICSFCHV